MKGDWIMYKKIIYLVFVILYGTVTFFGLGPVMFADGSTTERVYTLIIVIILYVVISFAFQWFLRKKK